MLLCRYDEFFLLPVAHAAINGVLKPFWRLMLRKPKTTLPSGDDLRIDRASQQAMSRRHRELCPTSCFTTQLPDIIKCDTLLSTSVCHFAESCDAASSCEAVLEEIWQHCPRPVEEASRFWQCVSG